MAAPSLGSGKRVYLGHLPSNLVLPVITVTTLLQPPLPSPSAVPSQLRARFNSFHVDDISTGPGVTWESPDLR